jgi:hypothetical protein
MTKRDGIGVAGATAGGWSRMTEKAMTVARSSSSFLHQNGWLPAQSDNQGGRGPNIESRREEVR